MRWPWVRRWEVSQAPHFRRQMILWTHSCKHKEDFGRVFSRKSLLTVQSGFFLWYSLGNHPNERMLNLDFLLWLKCPLRTTPTSSGSLNPESLWKDTDFLRLGCSAPSLVTSSTTTMVRSPSWRPSWGSAILEQPVISQNSCADSADDCLPGLYDRSIWWCDVGGSLINYLWNSVWDHLHWVDNVYICHSLKYVQRYTSSIQVPSSI